MRGTTSTSAARRAASAWGLGKCRRAAETARPLPGAVLRSRAGNVELPRKPSVPRGALQCIRSLLQLSFAHFYALRTRAGPRKRPNRHI